MLNFIEKLIQEGADLNKKNAQGETLLMVATQIGHLAAVQKLLEYGANPFLFDEKGQTALMKAVLSKQEKICSFLMGAMNGGIEQRDKNGERALDMARRLGFENLVELLESFSPDLKEEDHLFKEVQKEYAAGNNFNGEDENGFSYLMHMVYRKFNKIAKFLIGKNVDINHQCQRGMTALHMAVMVENEEMVKVLLDLKADLTLKNRAGDTALEAAKSLNVKPSIISLLEMAQERANLKEGDFQFFGGKEYQQLVTRALEMGGLTPIHQAFASLVMQPDSYESQFNIKNDFGHTPLILAALIGDYEAAQLLIQLGGDVNMPSNKGETALMMALSNMDGEMANLLIEQGADVNAESFEGDTPLLMAVRLMNMSLIKLLIENGANIYRANQEGLSALDLVLKKEEYEIASFMKEVQEGSYQKKRMDLLLMKEKIKQEEAVDEVDIKKQEPEELTLFKAIESKKFTLLCQLIEQGANIHLTDDLRMTPLFRAIEMGQMKSTKLLIEKGADVNYLSDGACSPLMRAVLCDRPKILSYLIEKGADIDLKGFNGNTALMMAIEEGNNFILRQLIKAHADLEVENDEGETPLVGAMLTANHQAMRVLIEHGADIWKENSEGVSAMDIAIENDFFEEAALMKKVYEKRIGLPLMATLQKQIDQEEYLLKAIKTGNKKAIQRAVQKGADICLIDDMGEGVLFYCVRQKKGLVFNLLATLGANVNLKNKEGKTVLDVIFEADFDEKTTKRFLKTLMQNGFNLAGVSKEVSQKVHCLLKGKWVLIKSAPLKKSQKQKNKRERTE